MEPYGREFEGSWRYFDQIFQSLSAVSVANGMNQSHGVSLFVAPSSGHFWDYLQRHLAVIFGTILQRHLVVIFGTICSAIYRSFLNYLQRHLAVIFELFAAPSSGHFGTICSAI
jgi:hypothetical protein